MYPDSMYPAFPLLETELSPYLFGGLGHLQRLYAELKTCFLISSYFSFALWEQLTSDVKF